MTGAPPGFLRWWLERTLPADVRDGIVGDLDELYRQRRARVGSGRARVWYAAQVVAISGRFAVERLRDLLPSALGLDLKLGLRMLVKYPMLTIVGGVAITVASAIGVGASEFVRDMVASELPLEDGERVVRIYHQDLEAGGSTPASLYDLEVWRSSVSSVEHLGAYATMEQGLVSDRGEAGTVSLARISPSVFPMARVPPLLGRTLIEGEEEPGAPAVVVLGYGVWEDLLGADPDAIGRTVRLGGTPTTVVGVMPEGFGFPQTQDAWVPLQREPATLQPESAPRAAVFGRLADGATLASAQAELDIAGRRAAADLPASYEHLRPQVDLFANRVSTAQLTLILSGVGLLFTFLLVVACANVATLVFARTVTREGEIAVRRSLGATRRRIVFQLFSEALVLVGGATLTGMLVAWAALGSISRLFFRVQQEPQPPFWWNDALSTTTILYAGVLVLAGAVMVGVVPGLKATRGAVQPRLGQLASGGGGGLHLGGMWTAVIVIQVALTVAFLPIAVSQGETVFERPAGMAFPGDELVTAQIGRDPPVRPRTSEERTAFLESSRLLFDEVKDRVGATPGVAGVALASGLSAMNHLVAPVEVEAEGAALGGRARILLVDRSYLDLMGAVPTAGRALGPADFTAESRSVVVNETFVDQLLGGRNPVGAEIVFPERDGESSLVGIPPAGTSVDVVGVVEDPGIDAFGPGRHAVVYAALDLAPVTPRAVGLMGMPQAPAAQLYVRVRADGGLPAGRLHEIVTSVDATLRLSELGTASDVWAPTHTGERLAAWIFMAVAGIVLMLSVAGIYALMSFTVTRRTREIAIRTAVGATRRQIVRTVFTRAGLQLLAGVALGSLLALPNLLDGMAEEGPGSLVIVSVLLVGAGLGACLLPVRRALAVDAAAAMKAD